jgi:hypothetical protein
MQGQPIQRTEKKLKARKQKKSGNHYQTQKSLMQHKTL